MHAKSSELMNKVVTVKFNDESKQLRVLDWWDRFDPSGWITMSTVAAFNYAKRVLSNDLPDDNEVLCGCSKDGKFGCLFHVSEIMRA